MFTAPTEIYADGRTLSLHDALPICNEGNYPYVVGGTLFEAIGQLIARSGHCFAVHHLASTRGGADKYTIPRSVRNRVPANARAQPYIFSAIYRCGDNRAIRLGQKSFGREPYLDRKTVVEGKRVAVRYKFG